MDGEVRHISIPGKCVCKALLAGKVQGLHAVEDFLVLSVQLLAQLSSGLQHVAGASDRLALEQGFVVALVPGSPQGPAPSLGCTSRTDGSHTALPQRP